ncbi:MAG TPA: LuxR C-terminal-related transcriptional regulator [Stellaceae bacterium]|nr:LuxR C-terminal-related transcriptional regulator [Stellaceae bacterium]
MSSHSTIETFSDTVGLIYDAAADPAAWPAALQAMVKLFDGFGASLFVRDIKTFRGRHVTTWNADMLNEYWRLLPLNPFVRRPRPPRSGSVETDRMVIPRSAWEGGAWHNDYWMAHEYGSGIFFWLQCDGERQQYMSLSRWRGSAEFDRRDIELAGLLLPHLRRALLLDRGLRRRGLDSGTACDVLDELSHGLIIIDRAGRVVYTNLAADRLLGAGDGLAIDKGRLCGATPMVTARLDAILARAAGDAELVPTSGAMPLPRPSGKPALALVAIPLRRELDWLGPRRAAVCICIADPAHRPQPPAARLSTLYGLTAAEADVARILAGGADVREISAQLQISYHTARTHIARIMEKTGTRRQAELVGLLAKLPQIEQ